MKKLISKFRENAIWRFLYSYILLMILAVAICYLGFTRAFSIVKKDLIYKNQEFMNQGISQINNYLSGIYTAGIKMSLSANLRRLGTMDGTSSEGYYDAVTGTLSEYSSAVKYLYPTYSESPTFIYLNNIDRVLFKETVYTKEVYQNSEYHLDILLEEWYAICNEDYDRAFFYISSAEELFYVFPCYRFVNNQERYGTIFWEIARNDLVEYMRFLEQYSEYSMFINVNGQKIVMGDGFNIENEMKEEWLTTPGVYRYQGNYILTVASDQYDITYTIVISSQESMKKLTELKLQVIAILLILMVAGIGVGMFFSVRSGRPINEIADMLAGDDDFAAEMDMDNIRGTIERLIDEQKKNVGELRKAFFYNLLKADFVSRAEMQYMASRVGIQLLGESYFAAVIHYFPQIDVEIIDDQTLEEVRAVQVLSEKRMKERCKGQIWFYKRNTMETLCVVEMQEEDILLELLTDTAIWLKNVCHVDACWGVGTPCKDLIYFWKSAEEAQAALENGDGNIVCLYSQVTSKRSEYFISASMAELLRHGLRTGNSVEAQKAVEMIRQENVETHSIGHRQFLRLNREVCEIIAVEMTFLPDWEEKLTVLSALAAESKGDYHDYFEHVVQICNVICEYTRYQKGKLRNAKIQMISDYLQENYSDAGLCLSLISDKFKISEGYLSSIFKEEMGINFGDYLENIRIEAACDMLRGGALVAVVAEKTGYNSVQSFRRAFKRVKKVSPSEYKI